MSFDVDLLKMGALMKFPIMSIPKRQPSKIAILIVLETSYSLSHLLNLDWGDVVSAKWP